METKDELLSECEKYFEKKIHFNINFELLAKCKDKEEMKMRLDRNKMELGLT